MRQMCIEGTESWTKEKMKEAMINPETQKAFVLKGLIRIYEYQTTAEQESEESSNNNGVGFNKVDAEILSSFAKRLLNKQSLTPKQYDIACKRMLKYAGQLTKIANNMI